MNRIDIARLFLFVREKEQNRGLRVESIQHWSTGEFGDSWCAEFVTMVLDLEYQGDAPISRQGGVQTIRELAEKQGWITATPSVGDLYLYIDANDHAHHIGILTSVDPMIGISGNTSEDGTSSNGDRVAEHGIHATTFIHLPE